MLDLNKCSKRTYKIKWLDGEVLKLKLPTRAMLISMMDLTKEQQADESESIEKLLDLMVEIFNRNENGKIFTKEMFDSEFALDDLFYVLADYLSFGFERMGESLSPASRTGQGMTANLI